MYYLDAAQDRLLDEYGRDVEVARLGTVFAHNPKPYGAWRRRQERLSGRSSALVGNALEAAVMGLARTNPEYVVMGA